MGIRQIEKGRVFDAIIGNPPYIRYQDLYEQAQKLSRADFFSRQAFIHQAHKCMGTLRYLEYKPACARRETSDGYSF